jgi:hypothetical protein
VGRGGRKKAGELGRGNYKAVVEGLSIYLIPKGIYGKREGRLSEASVIGWGIVPDKSAFDEC